MNLKFDFFAFWAQKCRATETLRILFMYPLIVRREVIGPSHLSGEKKFIGKFLLQELLVVRASSKIDKSLTKNPVCLNHDASVLEAMEVASNFVGETIPVINQSTNQIIGVVSEADIFEAYLSTQSKVHDLEHN